MTVIEELESKIEELESKIDRLTSACAKHGIVPSETKPTPTPAFAGPMPAYCSLGPDDEPADTSENQLVAEIAAAVDALNLAAKFDFGTGIDATRTATAQARLDSARLALRQHRRGLRLQSQEERDRGMAELRRQQLEVNAGLRVPILAQMSAVDAKLDALESEKLAMPITHNWRSARAIAIDDELARLNGARIDLQAKLDKINAPTTTGGRRELMGTP